ncbi:RES family NAD+ phosphorylase [Spirosoma utsteinense]|uniref:RES domain-containing protein n=1 Tax=Spirosoma utsteinense TaxID=2585773 RepID=A0ABR6WCK2_9BACT|nr:RES family NAD+ phosphorylase [Spirosoma utsteinense]MBC3788339.1 RES domain-containing protein [Spirosoma utsteinense]MBC3794256.1 RES domain-containing protein [Spirosoma utsteinense]
MLTVYRTVKAKYSQEPLATEGARLFGGRWNPKGFPLLYTTSSPALALVESLVHQPRVRYEKLPKLVLFTLEIPGDAELATTYLPEQLPPYWSDESYERSQWILRDWLIRPATLVAAVPSVVVPMSFNYLLHPAHPDFGLIRVAHQEPFPIEHRLWQDADSPPIDQSPT